MVDNAAGLSFCYNDKMIVEKIRGAIEKALQKLGIEPVDFAVEHPSDSLHGDYASNAAIVHAKATGKAPKELAEEIVKTLQQARGNLNLEKIEIAGAGFINFFLRREVFVHAIEEAIKQGNAWGRNERFAGKRIVIEHTQPNPFKAFHIGHLMNNAIGESLGRLLGTSGATLFRTTYHGDVGLHVAKAIWGMRELEHLGKSIATTEQLGAAYVLGSQAYESNPHTKDQIDALNKKIYDQSDGEVNALYERGRAMSLADFERQYARLGSTFEHHFFESEAAPIGAAIVKAHVTDGVFEESNGATIFAGEKVGLHTRVFITSQGLPTYEAKDLGLVQMKQDLFPFDESLVITANEQSDYFRVIIASAEMIWPDITGALLHRAHGMLRLPSGKMSSRTGDVITADALIADVKKRVLEKMKGEIPDKDAIAEQVAIGALKYSILRQAIGKDSIFDFDKSLSFEGDSGPYLQYTYARTSSILEKARKEKIEGATNNPDIPVQPVEQLLIHFSEVVARAAADFAPQLLVTYLTELASAWNNYYAHILIINGIDPCSHYRVALAEAVATTLRNGLSLLGIAAPERM